MCGKLLNLKCQSCGNVLTIEEDDLNKYMFCSACGSKYVYEEDKAVLAGHSEKELLNRGVQHLERGNFEYALSDFEEMTRFFPNNYKGWIGGLICNSCFDEEKIEGCAKNIKTTAPSSVLEKMGTCDVRDMAREQIISEDLKSELEQKADIEKQFAEFQKSGHIKTENSAKRHFEVERDVERGNLERQIKESKKAIKKDKKKMVGTFVRRTVHFLLSVAGGLISFLVTKGIVGWFIHTFSHGDVEREVEALLDAEETAVQETASNPAMVPAIIVGLVVFAIIGIYYLYREVKYFKYARIKVLKKNIAYDKKSIAGWQHSLDGLPEKYSDDKLKKEQELAVSDATNAYNIKLSEASQKASALQADLNQSQTSMTRDEYIRFLKSLV